MAAGNGNGNQTQNNNMSRTTNNGGVRRQNNNSARNDAPYKIYGTNEPYNGLTVEIGGYMYSTMGGALEGDSYQLLANSPRVTPNTDPLRTREIPNTDQDMINSSARVGSGNENTTPGGPSDNRINQESIVY